MNNENKNPYGELIGMIGSISTENNTPSLQIGRVVAAPPEIQIAYNGIILTKKELWINSFLLQGYPRTARGHITSGTQPTAGGSGDAAYESHAHGIDNDYADSINLTDTLKIGEFVFLMPFYFNKDRQQFAILAQATKLYWRKDNE